MSELTNLSGVGLGALAVILLWRMASEHIHRNTRALGELTQAIRDLENVIHRHA